MTFSVAAIGLGVPQSMVILHHNLTCQIISPAQSYDDEVGLLFEVTARDGKLDTN
ncbi:hypothetical protein [aff. Roholtiella sp. LEGE 12411]|uniref:hypothetical protein n=1 Tax=aff. Roholtiella sp. LEGE 12411 TaxID=1828822 RepID=UPI001881D740|nr:hypothetical protein [aff. Roholtiella sp. LEGE 12411]MBE9033570.1 hypothetical protein [aff. Roholtiella sp. LEGE 12411]